MYYCITINPHEEGIEHVNTIESEKLDCDYPSIRQHCNALGIDTFQILSRRIGNTDVQIYLDDDGKYKDMIPNDIATILADIYPYDFIVGPVIIMADPKNSETHYLTAEQVSEIHYHIKSISLA